MLCAGARLHKILSSSSRRTLGTVSYHDSQSGRHVTYTNSTPCSRRTLSTVSYYDSQSGRHVTYTNSTRFHGLFVDHVKPGDLLRGLSSVAVLKSSAPARAALPRIPELPVYIESDTSLAASLGAHVFMEFACTSPRARWDELARDCAAAKQNGQHVWAHLRGRDIDDVQLAACILADSGVDLLSLPAVDGDDEWLDEVLEALTGCDVAGVPMKQRLGLRLGCGDAAHGSILDIAARHGVKNFEVCAHGRLAPSPEALAAALTKRGLECPAHFKS